MYRVINISISPYGRARLHRLQRTATDAVSTIVLKNIDTILKPKIAELAPDVHKEAEVINRGIAVGKGLVGGRELRGHFMKMGRFLSIPQAILADKPKFRFEKKYVVV